MKVDDFVKEIAGRFDADPQVKHHFSGGVYAKQMFIPKGYVAATHKHNYSHLSILALGQVIVSTDDSVESYNAPACIEIQAGTHHKIEALQDCVWFCIHATDETDEDAIDAVLISKGT
jgi:quercetin dioxygenase-like cupin family protein